MSGQDSAIAYLFDGRRLDRIKRQVMSNEEAEKVVYDVALMQTALRSLAAGGDLHADGVAALARNVLEGDF